MSDPDRCARHWSEAPVHGRQEEGVIAALDGNGTIRGTEAASRVADVLLTFIDGPSRLGVTDIARDLQLSKAVVHRILQSLVAKQLLETDDGGGYRLGPAAASLGVRVLRDVDLRGTAKPILVQLRDATNETVTLSEIVGLSRVYVDQVESTREVRVSLGMGVVHPLHAGATGKAILAFLDPQTQREVLAGDLSPHTPRTVTNPDELRRQLAEIRASGVAVTFGERMEEVTSIAAPIFRNGQEVLGAVSLAGPRSRVGHAETEAYVPLVCEAASKISALLHWTGSALRG